MVSSILKKHVVLSALWLGLLLLLCANGAVVIYIGSLLVDCVGDRCDDVEVIAIALACTLIALILEAVVALPVMILVTVRCYLCCGIC